MRLPIIIMFSTLSFTRSLTIAVVSLLWTQPCKADGAPFLGTDPAVVSAMGETTLQQWFNWGYGTSGASFNSFESQSELDYGVSDRLQLALTVLYDWERMRLRGGPAGYDDLPGLAGEITFAVLPLDDGPLGVSLAIDPAINAHSRALAVRLLLEKRSGGFQHVLNINLDNEWEKDAGTWRGTSGVAVNYGLGYAIDRHWTIALEIGNELDFDELLIGGRLKAATNTVFAGPTVQYDGSFAVITFGVQAQLPLSIGSHAAAGYTDDAERWRAGLRLTHAI